ncbi:FAS1-like dehydratase domain-containing protein [Mycobacterium vicinigordonae]|uniref:MaoC family dehydratase N-terminal domain-containing protein n=1 Tax=Mycobacterium vicinigordonae TaxID=1719132 RepID=A0A7D6E1R8_9MYCO|nr:MaoC family dehydratase N-terminal domain-containing protein [Mycobacterium vicinigordonae]QLL10087.1 MaoC family dehydratase N-terminal domain-containing protein [Mycobacterium vicinigordonae]
MITDRLAAAIGIWNDQGAPSFPIDRSDIRRWAIATYWPDEPPRLYWDEEYARATRWGGIIAPDDFNPFAWPVKPLETGPSQYALPEPGDPGQRMLNGGVRLEFGQPMRPGDVITGRWRVKDASEREGRMGQMLYIQLERELRNQRNELVRTRIDTVIRY